MVRMRWTGSATATKDREMVTPGIFVRLIFIKLGNDENKLRCDSVSVQPSPISPHLRKGTTPHSDG